VQVRSNIYSICSKTLSVTKYTNLTDEDRPVERIKLASLGISRENFSVACFRDWAIYVTGGLGSNNCEVRHGFNQYPRFSHIASDTSDSAFRFDLITHRWLSLPKLDTARRSHSSCFLDKVLYVFGGYSVAKGHILSTVEKLNIGKPGSRWEAFFVNNFTQRILPAVCPISKTEIVIMGGFSMSQGDLGDVLIFDSSRKVAEKVLDGDSKLTFMCPNSAAMVKDGTVVSLVSDQRNFLKLIRYERHKNAL